MFKFGRALELFALVIVRSEHDIIFELANRLVVPFEGLEVDN
jgi:hypothetical protein